MRGKREDEDGGMAAGLCPPFSDTFTSSSFKPGLGFAAAGMVLAEGLVPVTCRCGVLPGESSAAKNSWRIADGVASLSCRSNWPGG